MNTYDLLNENEKIILLLFLKRTPMSQVAYLFSRPTDVINNVRLEMIAKFEQASFVKSPKPRSCKSQAVSKQLYTHQTSSHS
jgi:hypothetical protein